MSLKSDQISPLPFSLLFSLTIPLFKITEVFDEISNLWLLSIFRLNLK